jgi:hypothetical protein
LAATETAAYRDHIRQGPDHVDDDPDFTAGIAGARFHNATMDPGDNSAVCIFYIDVEIQPFSDVWVDTDE